MSKEHKFQTSMHLVLTVLHLVMTLAAFAISIAIVVFTLGANCTPSTCKSMIFITSTFFSSRQIETSYGWPVATERSQIGEVIQYPTDQDSYAFSHYYECMYTAQMADLTCPSLPSVNAYKACLHNNTAIDAALTICNALSSSNYVTHWPTTEEYTRCLFGHTAMRNSVSIRASQNVFKACVEKSLWPFFENQQTIDSNLPLGSFNWAIFITVAFVITTSFAVYTASWIEDGHVKYGEPQLFMRFGLFWSGISFAWCLAFFAIFTVVAFNHTTAFENNQGVPTTVSTVFVTLGLLGTCLLYFGSEVSQSQYWVFRGNTFAADAPDHLKRDHVEFSRERFAKVHKQHLHNSRDPQAKPIFEPDAEGGKQECGLRVPLQPASKEQVIILTEEQVAKIYTPPLISTWADGYLADGCLFLGFAGATGQLTSDQSWNIFVLITLYRVLNMMIARFMYEAFMNNLSLGDVYNKDKFDIKNYPTNARMGAGGLAFNTTPTHYDEHIQKLKIPDPHLDIRVLGLSTQIAALYVFSAICFIVFDGNYALSDFGVFKLLFFLCFIFPETIRVVIHVWYQIRQTVYDEIPWALLNTHFFIWIWDLLFRIIGVSIVILGSNHEMQGTREYLVSHANTLLGDYLRVLGVSVTA